MVNDIEIRLLPFFFIFLFPSFSTPSPGPVSRSRLTFPSHGPVSRSRLPFPSHGMALRGLKNSKGDCESKAGSPVDQLAFFPNSSHPSSRLLFLFPNIAYSDK